MSNAVPLLLSNASAFGMPVMYRARVGEDDVVAAITNGNLAVLKSIKGIGPKAAQRLIIELQDKLGGIGSDDAYLLHGGNKEMDEATEALIALGFVRSSVSKVLLKITKEQGNNLTTEQLIKKSLQIL